VDFAAAALGQGNAMTTIIERRAAGRQPVALLAECATCPGHCCKGDTILLFPEHGDNPAIYQAEVIGTLPEDGSTIWRLKHKPNGDCVYLDEVAGVGRCRVYNHRPAICRSFDCGKMFARTPRAERRRMIRDGIGSVETFEQGRRVQEARASRIAQEAREASERPLV
jgi:Fe-S-cluster containining protein